MNELVSQEDDEIKEQYEINEGEENNIDSNTDEQKLENRIFRIIIVFLIKNLFILWKILK